MDEWKDIDERLERLRLMSERRKAAAKAKKKKLIFTYSDFSRNQLKVISWWVKDSPVKDKDGIIADGSIRSGKTLSMSLSYALWAMLNFNNQNFGMAGKTISAFRRNVLSGLKLMLLGRGYTLKDHRADNVLTVSKGNIENNFYIFGGKDESSQDLIQGITLAGMFFDEVALMPESFVNQATARCSVKGSKWWFNCNPDGPDHYFYTEWIQKAEEKNLIYLHFTMDDNLSLAEELKQRYKNMYTGVFYDRYIRGLWVLAEGLIFRYFAEDDSKYLFEDNEIFETNMRGQQELKVVFSKITIGIDFGGNGSKTTFNLMGYMGGYKELRLLEEEGLPVTEEIDAKTICETFVRFYRNAIIKYGRVDWVFPDSASTTLINSLRTAAKDEGLPYRNIAGCKKNEVSERPVTVDLLLNTGRLKINSRCIQTRKAIGSLRWDEKKPNQPEDKNIGNCNDWWDSFNYCFLDFVKKIDLKR